jgi:hypothetical protein
MSDGIMTYEFEVFIPRRGMHKKMILYADGQPWSSSHAEDERGTLDREVDLGSSE